MYPTHTHTHTRTSTGIQVVPMESCWVMPFVKGHGAAAPSPLLGVKETQAMSFSVSLSSFPPSLSPPHQEEVADDSRTHLTYQGRGVGFGQKRSPFCPKSATVRVSAPCAAAGSTKEHLSPEASPAFLPRRETGPFSLPSLFPPVLCLTSQQEQPRFPAGLSAEHANNILAYFASKRTWKMN